MESLPSSAVEKLSMALLSRPTPESSFNRAVVPERLPLPALLTTTAPFADLIRARKAGSQPHLLHALGGTDRPLTRQSSGSERGGVSMR